MDGGCELNDLAAGMVLLKTQKRFNLNKEFRDFQNQACLEGCLIFFILAASYDPDSLGSFVIRFRLRRPNCESEDVFIFYSYFRAMLSLYEFNLLGDDEKANAVWSGTFLGNWTDPEFRVQLYRVDGFFVEVYYDAGANKIVKFRAFISYVF